MLVKLQPPETGAQLPRPTDSTPGIARSRVDELSQKNAVRVSCV